MAQLKHSEEEIIKLGEKLVRELDLEYSSNTLARWMSHYVAELIQNIDNVESKEEKKELQQECCDIILKIWSQKENLPITKPLDNLKPVIEILQVLNEKQESSVLPRWLGRNWKPPHKNKWASFAHLVKNNSDEVFEKIIQMNLHEDLLSKDKEWLKENKKFLSKDEVNFLELIDVMNDKFPTGVVDLNNFELSDDNMHRIEYMFDELENLIDEQKLELLKIKRNIIN